MEKILQLLRQFRDERDWEQFHSPKNLAVSVAIEAGELLEIFQWSADGNQEMGRRIDEISAEAADVMIYTLMLLDRFGLNPEEEIRKKIAKNAIKYPAKSTPEQS